MRLLLKLAVVALLLVLLALAAFGSDVREVPIREGKAADFWETATGVKAGWNLTHPIGGWFLYSASGFHGIIVYRAPAADVLANFPTDPETLGGEGGCAWDWTEVGFRSWTKVDPDQSNPRLLILHLREAQRDWWMQTYPDGLLDGVDESTDLGIAWQRMELFPLMRLAEWSYLSALIVFAAWPWLRNRGRWGWAIHVALILPLLMLPYYLGYCAWNFTSAGPGGGVVYPTILSKFRSLPWMSLDSSLIRPVPQVLAPLTGPVGPIMSLSGGRKAGPVIVLGLGVGLGAGVFVVGTFFRRRSSDPAKGDENGSTRDAGRTAHPMP